MAVKIKSNCTNCDMCEPECPNKAIYRGKDFYEVDPTLCTECVGFYDEPTCIKVCPIKNCIIYDPEHMETEDSLLIKFKALYS